MPVTVRKIVTDPYGCTHKIVTDGQKLEQSAVHRDGFFGGDIRTNSAAKMFVTDLDVRIRLKADTWTPGFTQWFCSHGVHVGQNNLAWAFTQHANSAFRTAISADGTNFIGPESTVPFNRPANSEQFIRSTVDTDIGGGLMSFGYWESLDRGMSWIRVGDEITVTGAPFNIHNSAGQLGVPGLTANASGAYYEFDWRQSIDSPTQVVYADFTQLDPSARDVGSFVGETGETWTLVGANIFNPIIVGKCFV
jgi:hypothetical protein